jgi:hypothetical protein
MVDRRDEARILAQALAVLDVRVDGLALDRPRPDERDLHVRSSRFSGRVRSRLCICARLSIWKSPIVSARWMSS